MDYSYVGSGKIYLREVGSAAGLVEVGNASALALAISENSIELKDYTKPGGGTYNEVRRIDSVEASMTLHDLSPSNLARALFGSASVVTAGTVVDESKVAYKGALVKFDNVPDLTVAPVVTGSGGTPTYVEGTDYEVRAAGIYILPTSSIADAATILVDYTKKATDVVEALTSSSKEYEIVFEGLNEARSGKPVIISLYRVRLGATQDLPLIGDEFAALELSGKVLADTSKTGGVSQYFKVAAAQ